MNNEVFKRLDKYVFSKDPLVKDDWYELLNSFQQELNELQQENKELKEQYCERTDCVGRLGNSKKVERLIQKNQKLHNKIDKAIDYLVNPVAKIWEGHSIDEVVRILKDSDEDE